MRRRLRLLQVIVAPDHLNERVERLRALVKKCADGRGALDRRSAEIGLGIVGTLRVRALRASCASAVRQ